MLGMMLPDLLQGVMAGLPGVRGTAEGCTRWALFLYSRQGDGPERMDSFFQAGGMGASPDHDGPSGRFFPIRALSTPIEPFEAATGLRVSVRELRDESAGAGRHRGGFGQTVELVNTTDHPVAVMATTPRLLSPARGVEGGGSGAEGEILVDGRRVMGGRFTVEPGQTLVLRTPGGGGWGPEEERPAALREADRRAGLSARRPA
jgi:N-methylhydantoinase B